MSIDKDKAERWSRRIILGLAILAMIAGCFLLSSLADGSPSPAFRADTPARAIPELTPEHRAALLAWVDGLEAAGKSLRDNLAALTLKAAAADVQLTNARKGIDGLNAENRGLKRSLVWARWKFSLLGLLGGALLAVAGFVLTRAGGWILGKAAAVGVKAII